MSAVDRTAGRGAKRGQPVEVIAPKLGVVSIAWTMSREAARGAFKQVAEQGGEVELRWTIDLDRNASTVSLVDGDSDSPIASGGASSMQDEDLVHLQAAAGQDEFVATLRGDAVLYARSTVLERVGVGGGRYEVVRQAMIGADQP